MIEEGNIQHDCIMVIVNRGLLKTIEVARQSGATEATIIRGRGTDEHQKVILPVINIELQPEKEIVLLITGTHLRESIADSIFKRYTACAGWRSSSFHIAYGGYG